MAEDHTRGLPPVSTQRPNYHRPNRASLPPLELPPAPPAIDVAALGKQKRAETEAELERQRREAIAVANSKLATQIHALEKRREAHDCAEAARQERLSQFPRRREAAKKEIDECLYQISRHVVGQHRISESYWNAIARLEAELKYLDKVAGVSDAVELGLYERQIAAIDTELAVLRESIIDPEAPPAKANRGRK